MNSFLISIHRLRILLAISPAKRIPIYYIIISALYYVKRNLSSIYYYYYLCVFGCFRAVGMTSIILDDAPLLCCLQLFSLFLDFRVQRRRRRRIGTIGKHDTNAVSI